MPSPIETLLRVQDSPVPTQTFFALPGSIVIAPIDWAVCSSKTGRYRVPPSSDFQTPPLAAPTNSVIFPEGSFVPAIAEMRPLIAAEPMLRAPRPEMVAERNEVSSAREFVAAKQMAATIVKAGKVTLTSILSQRERRLLRPLGEGWDEGSVQPSGDKDLKVETTERNFCKRIIKGIISKLLLGNERSRRPP